MERDVCYREDLGRRAMVAASPRPARGLPPGTVRSAGLGGRLMTRHSE